MKSTALLILAVLTVSVRAQTPSFDAGRLGEIKQLSTEQRWVEIVQLAQTDAARSVDVNYYYGIALARLERWAEAKTVFQIGLNQQPGDKRFPIELAGVSFKQNNYTEAARYLRRALRLDPADAYANDFLASVYFLQGNLEAALKYWNRVSKPHIEEVRLDPTPKLDPVVLDRAFAFAPADVLRLSQVRATEARVGGLNIFPSHRFDLQARLDGTFDLVFRASERNGWGNTKWEGLLSFFRGLPFQTIHPEFFNIRRRAINSESQIRWDQQKRRFRTSLSGPLFGDPKWRFALDLDFRNENWDVRSFNEPSSSLAGLNLRKQAFTAAATSFASGRWNWSSGVELSRRRFQDVTPDAALTRQLLSQGFQLKHLGRFNYELLRSPERRFFVTTGASTQIGRLWSEPSHAFAKLQCSLSGRVFPRAGSDDYEIKGGIRAGKTFGEIPFDELFALGVDRDNDLWLRSRIGTRDGRKGNAPLGRNYILINWELEKSIYNDTLVSFKLGPFLDTGKITDSSPGLGSQTWLWAVGIQAKVRVLGVGFVFSYGKDLRSGDDAFYVSVF